MRSAILLCLFAASLAAQNGSLEGTVVSQVDGQPIAGAHLTLITGDLGTGTLDKAYGAISDRAGHYAITALPAGLYLVIIDKTGYIQTRPTGMIPVNNFTLKPGEHITDRKMVLTPRALISGRVVDENGDPVEHVSVQIRPVPPDPEPMNMFGPSMNGTDDHGEFHLTTAPGKYYLQAEPRNWGYNDAHEIRTDGKPDGPFVTTYYPNAGGTEQASVVQVGPGQEVTALEIRLTRRPGANGKSVTVSGIVTGVPAGQSAQVNLRFGDSASSMYSGNGTSADSDGKFTFSGIRPGFYRAIATYNAGKTHLQSQPVEFRVESSNPPPLQLALAPGEDLFGALEIVGNPPPGASAAKPSVYLSSNDISGGMSNPDTTAEMSTKDNTFRIPGLLADKYHVHVDPLPENAFIKSITVDGVEVTDGTVDFSHGVKGSKLKIVVSLAGAQISGKVIDHDGQPLVSPLAVVLIWKDPKQKDSDNEKVTGSQYSIKGLKPGKYRLLLIDATDMLDADAKSQDEIEEFLKGIAEEVEVKEGDRIVKDLQAVDKEKLRAKKQ